MPSTIRFLAPDEACSYLPGRMARMEYEFVASMTADRYAGLMIAGWRRFGSVLFRPRCRHCDACRSLRVDAQRFRPNRSQSRNRRRNEGVMALEIGPPRVTPERLDLYQRFHDHRAGTRGWREREVDPAAYRESFVSNPIPTEEWAYRIDGRLVGLGLVDALPVGLSAIYFVHDPDESRRAPGTWNVLSLLEETRRRGLPHLYLGYWVADCLSLAYKANFRPHEVLGPDGAWRPAGP
ncbi:arginyl-tRNA-protein transferase [Aquisphaera giovannonii]|uniref:Aspartate/glutamate leucyltransferase n=1 Tax=Aquisphaera giovannonii TaxID=406548 RepID=A0A5B9VX22_9BACT|nr:arginyltransferase [Aquisphaera giovannonii]QEH32818.1 arginyl-tRNA-protein transferase [Aquisphaera giovannonii]